MLKRFSMLSSLTVFAAAILTITSTTIMDQPNEAYAQVILPPPGDDNFPPADNTNSRIHIDNSGNIDCDDKCDADLHQENTITLDGGPNRGLFFAPTSDTQIDNSGNIDCDDKCDADLHQENTITVNPPDTIILPTPFGG